MKRKSHESLLLLDQHSFYILFASLALFLIHYPVGAWLHACSQAHMKAPYNVTDPTPLPLTAGA